MDKLNDDQRKLVEENQRLAGYVEDIIKIRTTLIESDAIKCSLEGYTPMIYNNRFEYHIPYGYHITVDFDKMTEALYNKGFKLS